MINNNVKIACGIFACVGLWSCGSETGAGSFPDILAIGAKVVPYVSSGSLQLSQSSTNSEARGNGNFLPSAVDYTNGTSGNFNTDKVYIADILGTNTSGVNTQIIVQLTQLKSQIDEINASYSDADGNPANCTQTIDKNFIGSTDLLTVPFWDDSTLPVFWATSTNLAVVPKATCYVKKSESGYDYAFVFGRTAIPTPSEGCTDPYVYLVVNGYSQLNGTNSTDTANRGTAVSGHQSQVIYYNGCDKNVGIAMNLSTKYPNALTNQNDEFNARFELWGNADTNTFQVRVNKFDGMKSTSWGFNSFIGAGKASGTGNFILGFRRYNCSTEACTSATQSGTTNNYCLELGSTSGAVTVASSSSSCSTHTASFEDSALTYFTTGDTNVIPRSAIDFSSAAIFGL